MFRTLSFLPVAALLCAAAPSPVATYERMVADTMRDPATVQFRGTRQARTPEGKPALYGELNARNGYGGYAGFTPFCAEIIGRTAVVATGRDHGPAYVRERCGVP